MTSAEAGQQNLRTRVGRALLRDGGKDKSLGNHMIEENYFSDKFWVSDFRPPIYTSCHVDFKIVDILATLLAFYRSCRRTTGLLQARLPGDTDATLKQRLSIR